MKNLSLFRNIFILLVLIGAGLFYANIAFSQRASNAQICSGSEFVKQTDLGIQCSPLVDKSSVVHIENLFKNIINPVATNLPAIIPECPQAQRYIFREGAWGCKANTLEGIEFIGCPAGKYLNKITGGIKCLSSTDTSSSGISGNALHRNTELTWTEVITTGEKWSQRGDHQAIVLGTDIYVLGGNYSLPRSQERAKNDVWKSTDGGVTWIEVITTGTKWSARIKHQAVVLGTDIYVLGGDDGSIKNDVWKSTDKGVTWTEVITTGTKWSVRQGHQAVVLGTDIYVLGGNANNFFADRSYKNDIWKSTDNGVTWTEVITTGTKWSQRDNHQAIVLGTDIYVLGGDITFSQYSIYKNDVWKSTDKGVTWTEVITTGTKWSERSRYQAVVLGTDIYVLGGNRSPLWWFSRSENDVWKSTDKGVTWTEVITTGTKWVVREAHQAVVLGTDIYVLGGASRSSKENDVWKHKTLPFEESIEYAPTEHTHSPTLNDAPPTTISTWAQVDANGSEAGQGTLWGGRVWHQAVSFKGNMYLLGGKNNVASRSTNKNDVWKSADGETWTRVTTAAEWSARVLHQVVVFGEYMYLLGGSDGRRDLNDVWRSTDGETWTRVTTTGTIWSGRYLFDAVEYNGAMYLFGGYKGSSTTYSDVWKSTDGSTWTRLTSIAPWGKRWGHKVVVFNGAMYLLGGASGGLSRPTVHNNVWKSTDGTTWTQVTSNAGWAARWGHQVIVAGGYIYLLGGQPGAYNNHATLYNDVWRSVDGETWTQVDANGSASGKNAPWSGRSFYQALIFNNAIYIIGGNRNTYSAFNDIWKLSSFTPPSSAPVPIAGGSHQHTIPICTGKGKALSHDGTNFSCKSLSVTIPNCSTTTEKTKVLTLNGTLLRCVDLPNI